MENHSFSVISSGYVNMIDYSTSFPCSAIKYIAYYHNVTDIYYSFWSNVILNAFNVWELFQRKTETLAFPRRFETPQVRMHAWALIRKAAVWRCQARVGHTLMNWWLQQCSTFGVKLAADVWTVLNASMCGTSCILCAFSFLGQEQLTGVIF